MTLIGLVLLVGAVACAESDELELSGHGFCGSVSEPSEVCLPDAVVSLGPTTQLTPSQTILYSDERIRLEVPTLEPGAVAVVVSVEGVASNAVVIEVLP